MYILVDHSEIEFKGNEKDFMEKLFNDLSSDIMKKTHSKMITLKKVNADIIVSIIYGINEN